MSGVFLDTVGMVALWNRSDQWHDSASQAHCVLDPRGTPFYSTTLVLAECANTAARTPFRSDVDDLRQRLEARGTLVWPTAEDWHEAWAAYREGRFDQAGLVDQVSFLVVRRMNITRAFTNDRHFREAGFETLF
jgi:uncharacterized protein